MSSIETPPPATSGTKPTTFSWRGKNWSLDELRAEFGEFANMTNYSKRIGRSDSESFFSGRQKEIMDLAGAENFADITGNDYSGDFDATEAQGNWKYWSKQPGKGKRNRTSYNAAVTQLMAENNANQAEKYYGDVIEPGMDRAQGALDKLGQPVFDAQYINDQRSQMVQTVKEAEGDRLRRVSAVLGLRGLDPSSPAGAAIAARTALDADSEISQQLMQFGMSRQEIERAAQSDYMKNQSTLTMARVAARSAALNHDREALARAGENLNAIITSIQQSIDTAAAQRDAANKNDKIAYINMALNGLQAGAKILTAGAGGTTGGLSGGPSPALSQPSPGGSPYYGESV